MSAGQLPGPRDHARARAPKAAACRSAISASAAATTSAAACARAIALETYSGADRGTAGRFASDPFWGRTAYVGLQGAFGTSLLGRCRRRSGPRPACSTRSATRSASRRASASTSAAPSSATRAGTTRSRSRRPKSTTASCTAFSSTPAKAMPGSTGKNVGVNALYTSGPLSATGNLAARPQRTAAGAGRLRPPEHVPVRRLVRVAVSSSSTARPAA